MRFFRKLFGEDHATSPPPVPAVPGKLGIDEFGHNIVSIDALGFMGQQARSPDGRYRLLWSDRSPDGRHGGYREDGHGTWMLLRDDRVVISGQAERPQDGRVADNGIFILHDWMFGQGLQGRFLAFGPDGSARISQDIAANLTSNSLAPDGRVAICQTARAPGSPDSCQYIVFDVEGGRELARWEVETGWAAHYEWDCDAKRVFLCMQDGERVAYDFSGTMIDREAWQLRRIAAGDLAVIRAITSGQNEMDDALREAVLAGLAFAARNADIWSQARAFRQLGELHEGAGDTGQAIKAYDEALAIDPRIGVARRVEQLRKSHSSKGTQSQGKKAGRIGRQAERMGIGHEVILLEKGEGPVWRHSAHEDWSPVEQAALQHYVAEGWSGSASEGGLILTLLKAASFGELQPRHADTFVEALYSQNVAFAQDRFDTEALVATVSRATAGQIAANWKVIAATAGHSPAWYPNVAATHVNGLFEALGARRLADIAGIFGRAPYDLRSGWPDLTLWKGNAIRFVEVKAPSDSFHATQARLVSSLLIPLGYSVTLAEVRPKE